MRVVSICILLLLVTNRAIADESTSTPAKQYLALVEKYEQEGGARQYAKQFLTLAEQHAQTPTAANALLWVVKNVRGRSDTTKALERLKSDHVDFKEIVASCKYIARSRSLAAEPLLRQLLEKSPHTDVRAQACYSLAQLLESQSQVVDQLRKTPSLAPRVLQYYGTNYGKHLSSLDPESLAKQREQVYVTMLKSFPSVIVISTLSLVKFS
ncbi:MAG: hypothetical protein OSA89_18145 [Mariniblastus sp.]|nr:hypothetical protein [Mariniblastus sp.]